MTMPPPSVIVDVVHVGRVPAFEAENNEVVAAGSLFVKRFRKRWPKSAANLPAAEVAAGRQAAAANSSGRCSGYFLRDTS